MAYGHHGNEIAVEHIDDDDERWRLGKELGGNASSSTLVAAVAKLVSSGAALIEWLAALRSQTEATRLAREMLAVVGSVRRTIRAVLALNWMAGREPYATEDRADLDGIRGVVERVLKGLALDRYEACVELLRPVERVKFDVLDNEDKVRIVGTDLVVHEPSVRDLGTADLNPHELALAGALYVVHEVVHLAQRIGDKAVIAKLRATGAETTLMHLDLDADHVACWILSRALTETSMTELKDLQGRSAVAFPTGPFHSAASRARKARRLVGLRLDYLARRAGVLPADTDEYLFADYGSAGGNILLLRSGPPQGVLGIAPLNQRSADVLHTAADRGAAGLAQIDAIVEASIRSGCLPSGK